jgi:hypothetical protein
MTAIATGDSQGGIQLPAGVQLEKKYTNECKVCKEEFLAEQKGILYCPNCAVATLCIMQYKQMLANRWKCFMPVNTPWVRRIAIDLGLMQ